MPGSTTAAELAKRRRVTIDGQLVTDTPLLIPSFSSKGFPSLQKLYDSSAELITDCCLISAYDLHYGAIRSRIPFVDFIFLDSGGYESSKDQDFADLNYELPKPRSWTKKKYLKVLSEWNHSTPTVVISYDHPRQRIPLVKQIEEAESLFKGRAVGRELLIKPSTKDSGFVDVAEIVKNVHRLANFDIIGVTEKELGNSPIGRMRSIAQIRQAMSAAGLDLPIHVFGSLDTISSPMYFIAGADIFDGLTWLRMAYYKGFTVYGRNMALVDYAAKTTDAIASAQMLASNYRSLQKLQGDMHRYLVDHDYGQFEYHGDLLERVAIDLAATL